VNAARLPLIDWSIRHHPQVRVSPSIEKAIEAIVAAGAGARSREQKIRAISPAARPARQ
jgi:hypothetical protein